MLKFVSFDIVFQEIPDEVTLAVNLSNCPNRCIGCHSVHLWDDIGDELDEDAITSLLNRYGSSLTCFCFMGGDKEPEAVARLARFIRTTTELKTAWYSGSDELSTDLSMFNYVKVGSYIEEYGGLKERSTNQRFFRIEGGCTLQDFTSRFWK